MSAEIKICVLLYKHPEGLFGSNLVYLGGGYLKRSGLYATLGRLEEKGYVSHEVVPANPKYNRDRPKYKITQEGSRFLYNFCQDLGLRIE